MAIVHLICGPVGAGKTTYANRLADELDGVVFSIDAWMRVLFWPDAPKQTHLEWAMERVGRCEQAIWPLARSIAARGLDPVLDLGFLRAEQRERFRRFAKEAGLECKLHLVTASREVRRQRVAARNLMPGAQSIEVPDPMFEFGEKWFQAPDAAELAGAVQASTD